MSDALNANYSPEAGMSFGERMRTDPEFRDAYNNTTSAHLFADPENESTDRIIDMLQKNSLAYFFTEDEYIPRPMIISWHGVFVGEGEIVRAITRVIVPAVFGSRSD